MLQIYYLFFKIAIYSSYCVKKNKKKEQIIQYQWSIVNNFIPLHPHLKNDAPLAQLVEHLTLNQGVQGSNP